MGKIDPIWFTVFSDWLINLSAGWFGAAIVDIRSLSFYNFFSVGF